MIHGDDGDVFLVIKEIIKVNLEIEVREVSDFCTVFIPLYRYYDPRVPIIFKGSIVLSTLDITPLVQYDSYGTTGTAVPVYTYYV